MEKNFIVPNFIQWKLVKTIKMTNIIE